MDRDAGVGTGQQDDPARVAKDDRRAHVAGVEDILDRHRVGLVAREQLAHPVTDVLQPRRERAVGLGAYDAALHEHRRRARADHTVAGDGRAGVDAEDQHGATPPVLPLVSPSRPPPVRLTPP